MAANFKDETIEIIAGREIDEYYFHRLNEYDEDKKVEFYGAGEINWSEIPTEWLSYDGGFGLQEWDGWITFKNSSDWLARDEYDGSEWWSLHKRPTLKDKK